MELHRRASARRMLWPALAVGALLGVGARLTLDVLSAQVLHAPYYASTLAANLLGTLILFGLTARRQRVAALASDARVTAGSAHGPAMSDRAWLLWATGFCGSFTTYSGLALLATHVSTGYPLPPSWIDEATVPLPLLIVASAAMGMLGATFRWRMNVWLTRRCAALQGRLALAAKVGRWVEHVHSSAALVPVVGIAVINVLGSGVAGVIVGGAHVTMSGGADPRWVAVVWLCAGSGILGAFTTFSTAVVDAWGLYRQGHRLAGALIFAGVWILACGVFLLGYQIAWVSACGAL